MLDTNVYIQRLKHRLPPHIQDFAGQRRILHSAVACAELSISAGLLHPGHPSTAVNRAAIMGALRSIDIADVVHPSASAWAEAGTIAGILARTQYLAAPRARLSPAEACCQDGIRRKLINDALLFLSACEQGAILLSMNSRDMDLLLRFRPAAHILLFSPT